MDGPRFDSLLRALAAAPSRRGMVRVAAAATLVGPLAALLRPDVGEVKRKRKKKHKKRHKKKPPACAPACTDGKTCQSGSCVCPAERKDCGGACIPAGNCCLSDDCLNAGETCISGACTCPDGQEACGGECLAFCSRQFAIHNPVTCACCLPSGTICERDDTCCSGLACPCTGASGGCTGREECPGRALGDPCDFDAQCASGFRCNTNHVCA